MPARVTSLLVHVFNLKGFYFLVDKRRWKEEKQEKKMKPQTKEVTSVIVTGLSNTPMVDLTLSLSSNIPRPELSTG